MSVPSTVASMRGQVREALKLVLVEKGIAVTVLGIDADYGTQKDKAKFPLAKVWSPQTLPSDTKLLGPADTRKDRFMVAIAPWCTASDFEDATDAVLATNFASLRDDIVAQMDGAYAPFLGKFEFVQGDVLETSLANPRAVVQIMFDADYRLT